MPDDDWTVKTLRAYLEAEINAVRELLQERHNAQVMALAAAYETQQLALVTAVSSTEKAITKAEVASEKRFDQQNHFRQQLTEQAATFMPRVESVGRHDATTEKIADLIAAAEKGRDLLSDRVTALALALERANATGQTIYVLRAEAAQTARNVDEKIATNARAVLNETKTLAAGLAELRDMFGTQGTSYMSRVESDAKHATIIERFDAISEAESRRLGALEVGVGKQATRRELEQATLVVEEKLKDHAQRSEKARQAILEQVNSNALAIERANAAGQTIYVLRAEAATAAKSTEDKILSAVAGAASNHKLVTDSLAELRAQLAEQATRFMPRAESETRTSASTERLREIEIRIQSYPSRDETAVALSAADQKFAAGIGAVTEKTDNVAERLAALDLRLSSRLDLSSGKSSGYSAVYGWAIAAVGVLISVIVMANALLGK